jgi:AcrR family transcriptional regulator
MDAKEHAGGSDGHGSGDACARPLRIDARRNEQALLDAAAALFITSGVEVTVREIATKAGVGMGTLYRHFPTRADLIIAVYRHQVETCAEAGPVLLSESASPYAALRQWIFLFVDFLTTKHGLAAVMQSDKTGFETLHTYFLDRLVPVCTHLLNAAVEATEIRPDVEAFELMWGVGSLCASRPHDPRLDVHRLVDLLIAGLRRSSR